MMHGAHIASIGGTWMALVYGFAGMRDHGGCISFRPRLPDEGSRLAFPLVIKGQGLKVDIDRAATTYPPTQGEQLTIHPHGKEIPLSTATADDTRPNPPAGAEPESDFAACGFGPS